jgi:hypothetical protein
VQALVGGEVECDAVSVPDLSRRRREADRAEFLDTASRAWRDLDPEDYPFIRAVAEQMREHDDRGQFLAGIDLVLAGITTRHLAGPE